MNQEYLKKWMEETNRRLEVLEGKKDAPAPAPVSRKPVKNYPRWIYRRNSSSGEVEAMLVNTEAEMPPEGTYADSPAKLDEAEEFEAVIEPSMDEPTLGPEIEEEEASVPDMTGEAVFVEIPEDWRTMHHSSRIKLAKQLPGGDDVVTNDDAIALIELELENRGNAE